MTSLGSCPCSKRSSRCCASGAGLEVDFGAPLDQVVATVLQFVQSPSQLSGSECWM